ncbi:DUF6084 family protein [Kitasatospora cathayae]|uniref:DUF6084 family protein n=1 Tax=Kitasatospora cathayae TaxID=3004092 RepID=A0ABY7PX44_9ACTN|nr:DUF6084 family protein [Kitasatospora sp. HUAS 3-15]WBP85005.1 DUF6084 family protein [Kitasatospora sp. HUAS 3-15]
MTSLGFACTDVRSDPYAAVPTLVFRLRITAPADIRVHALALQCQLRIEPGRRSYLDAEGERLGDLFGERERWATTLNPIQFATVPLLVPGFTGETEADLAVPCSYDLEVACARYFRALEGGEVPLLLLFSGTAFAGPGGFQVTPVPWDKEARVRMPVRVWREAVDRHFPGCGWLRLPEDLMDELLAYRSRRALPSWDATVRELLTTAAVGEGAG